MTPLENRITILSDILAMSKYKRELYSEFLDDWGIGLYTAFLITHQVIADITPLMKTTIDIAWEQLLELHGLEDTGFDEFWEVDSNLPTKAQYYADRGLANE